MLKLNSPEQCDKFATNALAKNRPDLAKQARQRAVQLMAEEHDVASDAEKDILKAIYAYERALYQKHGKNIRASRTWQMVRAHGLKVAAERAVNRKSVTAGYEALVELGLEEFAFESVIARYPEEFSPEAVEISRERIAGWKGGPSP